MAVFTSIGHENYVCNSHVIAILSTPRNSPNKRLREAAEFKNKLLDGTCGNKTRSIIVMSSNHIVLSAINSETMAERFNSNAN